MQSPSHELGDEDVAELTLPKPELEQPDHLFAAQRAQAQEAEPQVQT